MTVLDIGGKASLVKEECDIRFNVKTDNLNQFINLYFLNEKYNYDSTL